MLHADRKWLRLWPLLYGSIVTYIAFAGFLHWAYDDPFITYRYAANLMAGNGFVYNPGLRVLSTTTPLFTLVLALLGKVWPDLPTLGNLLSAVSLALGGLFLWLLGREWRMPQLKWSVLLIYPTFPLLFSTFGGEMLFYTMLCLGAFVWYAQRRYVLTALFGGLALLARADAVLVLILLSSSYILCHRDSVPWRALTVFTLVTLPWFTFAWWYFGSPIPATLVAKQHQAQMTISQTFAGGFFTLASNYGRFWVYRLEAVLAVIGLLYALLRQRKWILFLAWPVLYFSAYTMLGVPRYFWYYAPLVSGFVVAVGLGIESISAVLFRTLRRPAWVRFTVLLILLSFTAQQLQGVWRLRQHPDRRTAIYRDVGEWLEKNTPPQSLVGTLEVGIIGYYARRPMVDFAGLIQPDVASQFMPQTTYEDAALWATEHYLPDYLVLHKTAFPRLESSFVAEYCTPVQQFSGKMYGYSHDLVVDTCRLPQ